MPALACCIIFSAATTTTTYTIDHFEEEKSVEGERKKKDISEKLCRLFFFLYRNKLAHRRDSDKCKAENLRREVRPRASRYRERCSA
jgi:hypothetical protein